MPDAIAITELKRKRICLICEGSYPYIPGGVSSWVHTVVTQFPEYDFIVWSIATSREEMSKLAYELPANVVELRTVYLRDMVFKAKGRSVRLNAQDKETLRGLVSGSMDSMDWASILELAKRHRKHISNVLMSESFYDICLEEYKKQESKKVFNQFLWNLRGVYFPLLYLLSQDIPQADIYHAVSAGYAGILGSFASYVSGSPLLLSEHGIYTREREEDIIRSQWVAGDMKGLWIDFFKKLSREAYKRASVVTTLFETNRSLQIELDCPEEKIVIVPNGVDVGAFADLEPTLRPHPLTLGSILRVVSIKDVKTMLLAFSIVKQSIPDARLLIMGNTEEDPLYYQECLELVEELAVPDVQFLGQVDIRRFLPEIDILLLTSISEGQPLAVLEGMAAKLPFVTTNVGDCRDLLDGYRADDTFGKAGLVVPVMNSEATAEAILQLARKPEERKRMGEAGRERVRAFYSLQAMIEAYRIIYKELEGESHGRNGI